MNKGARRAVLWIGLPVLVAGMLLTALRTVPVAAPTVRVQWAQDVDAELRATFERRLHLVNGKDERNDRGFWTYLVDDISRANLFQIVNASVVTDTRYIDRRRFVVTSPNVVRRVGPAPLQSWDCFGLGLMLLVGTAAPDRRLRAYVVGCGCVLLLVAMFAAPLPTWASDDNNEWMGDYDLYTGTREQFENFFGDEIHFSNHLSSRVLRGLDGVFGADTDSPAQAFRWMSLLAGVLFLSELVVIGLLFQWSAGVMRYVALCLAAPVTLFFFGFGDVAYLSLSAAAFPLLIRGSRDLKHRLSLVGAAVVMGLRAALHGFGLVSFACAGLSLLGGGSGDLRTRLGHAFNVGGWAMTAYLGWLLWYLAGLHEPVVPGHAADLFFRPLYAPDVFLGRVFHPILSILGLREIITAMVLVGVPVVLLGLRHDASTQERRMGLLFALPSLVFLVLWWPAQGIDRDIDTVFAAFPAFFAGVWLCSRSVTTTAIAFGFLGLAHAGFWFVVQSGQFSATMAALP